MFGVILCIYFVDEKTCVKMAMLFGGGRKVEKDPLKAYCSEIRRNVREIEGSEES